MNSTLNRRVFHALAGTSVASLVAGTTATAAEDQSEIVAFLSDTHISSDPQATARGIKMADHLQTVVGQVVDTMPQGAHVIINGDCAYLKGLDGDYQTLAKLLAPLAEKQLQLHVTMGNHDDRAPLYKALRKIESLDTAVDEKHVDVIRTRHADLVLIDSLWKVNKVTGKLGDEQLQWLTKFLQTDSDRPVIVIGHHNLQITPPPEGKPWSGLEDTAALAQMMLTHPRVKAYFYGHTHRWENRRLESPNKAAPSALQLVNLPAVAYVFDAKQPSGWTLGTFSKRSLQLKLSALDTSHPSHDEELTLPLEA